jgi:hydrogenase maturation factor
LAGTVGRDELVEKSRAAPGDNLLITKGIAVEGTAILAHDLSDRLLRAGIPEQVLEKGRQFINDIAILKEAELAANTGMVTAMHDVTEGGFATAVEELSKAAGKRLRVDMELLPIYPETQQICTHLGIDPLGLIGSGSLLMCCKPEGVSGLINRLAQENINAIVIGEVLEEGTGVEAFRNGHPVTLPEFAVDEIATVL